MNPAHAALRGLTKAFDAVNIRVGRPRLNGKMYIEAQRVIQPGDLILSRTALRPTNLIIPGYFKHVEIAAMELGSTIEATYPCVRDSTLVDIWTAVSHVRVVRPRWATEVQRAGAAVAARTFLGTLYDSQFQMTKKSLYCSELAYEAYRMVGADMPTDVIYAIGAYRAIPPQSFTLHEHFETIFDSSA